MSSTQVLQTAQDFFGLVDIETKLVTFPNNIPVWAGKQLYIKQLTRGQQDQYLKRRFGTMKVKQDAKAKNQEISEANIYGHDAWLLTKGVCNADGKPIFSETDIQKINEKSGEAVGWIATQIIEFSGMAEDVDTTVAGWHKKVCDLMKENSAMTCAEVLKLAGPEPEPEEKAAEDLKNS